MKRVLFLTVLIVALFTSAVTLADNTTANELSELLKVHVINVSHGDAILIQAPQGQEIMIDVGRVEQAPVVARYLYRLGIKEIEHMIVTHPHNDHMGGIYAFLETFAVNRIIEPMAPIDRREIREYRKYATSKGVPIVQGRAGDSFELSPGITVQLVGPVTLNNFHINDNSIVAKITYGETSFLFMGDTEITEEKSILASGADLSADVIKIGHHGLYTSSSQEFLDNVQPKYAVISCAGKEQPLGRCSKSVIRRLNANNIPVYRTDLHGDIVFTSDGVNIQVEAATGL